MMSGSEKSPETSYSTVFKGSQNGVAIAQEVFGKLSC